jgi:hypothetical protein
MSFSDPLRRYANCSLNSHHTTRTMDLACSQCRCSLSASLTCVLRSVGNSWNYAWRMRAKATFLFARSGVVRLTAFVCYHRIDRTCAVAYVICNRAMSWIRLDCIGIVCVCVGGGGGARASVRNTSRVRSKICDRPSSPKMQRFIVQMCRV